MKLPKKSWKYLLPLLVIVFCALSINTRLAFRQEPDQSSHIDSVDLNHEEPGSSSDEMEVSEVSMEKEKALKARLFSIISGDDAAYSIYVLFPSWSIPLVENNQQQSSASIIKIFILSTAYEMAERGELDLDEKICVRRKDMVGGAGVLNARSGEPMLSVRELLQLMITESDNTATNVLIDHLTFSRIQNHCEAHGFTNTILCRKMMDIGAMRAGYDNLTTVEDVGEWMRCLRNRQLVSPSADASMEQTLFAQMDTECFPCALPQASIAHKTGELTGVYHDAGIIYENNKSYVLVIFSSKSVDRHKTLSTMRQMAKIVNEYFLSDN